MQPIRKLLLLIFLLPAPGLRVNAQATPKPVSKNVFYPLPPCIETLQAKDSMAIAIEYRYKRQQWFVIHQPKPIPNHSDNIITTRFFDDSCRLVCTWKKGGIAGLNKVMPDTIEKNKVFPFVPDTILQIAKSDKIQDVLICRYNKSVVYLLSQRTIAQNRSTCFCTDRYYSGDGKLVRTNSYTQPWNRPRQDANLIPELNRFRL